MGAFRKKSSSLHSSLQFELSQATKEVACEYIKNGVSEIAHANVGLMVKNTAIVKKFNGDCWSVRNSQGLLEKTRNPRHSGSLHAEAWAKPHYVAIVLKKYQCLKKSTIKTVVFWAKEKKMPILELKRESDCHVILREILL